MFEATLTDRQGRLDRLQIAALFGLMFLGIAFVYSATMATDAARSLPWYHQGWIRQMIWYALGIGAAATLCFVDYHILARWSFVAYWISIIGLVVVLIPGIGSTQGWGARRWIDLGVFSAQPS